MKTQKILVGVGLLVGLTFLWFRPQSGWSLYTPPPAPPFIQCDVSTGFPGIPGVDAGLIGIATLPDGTVRTVDCCGRGFFSFVLPGPVCPKTPGAPTNLLFPSPSPVGAFALALGLDGELYATVGRTPSPPAAGTVVQLDPSNGNTLRCVANLPVSSAPGTGIAVDPRTGDLYVTDEGNSQVDLITNPATSACSTPQNNLSVFSPSPPSQGGVLSGGNLDGLAWSCDGLFLLVAENAFNEVALIDRTGTASVFATLPAGASGPDGVAFGAQNTSLANFAFTNNNNGTVTEINLSTRAVTIIASGGNRGDHLTVDQRGNLLLTQVDRVTRLSTNNGGQWDLTGGNLCSNLRCASLAATSCTICVTDPVIKSTISALVKPICASANCNPAVAQKQLCSLISFLNANAPNCTALLTAARTLRDTLSAVSPSTCPGT